MLNRRNLIAFAFACAILPISAKASEADFTQEAFATAQKQGKSILVDVWASWCPTCKAQAPLIKAEMEKPENKDMVVLRVNFDTQTDVLQAFNAQSQSTLIMFKGDKETARTVGDTSAEGIAQLIASAK